MYHINRERNPVQARNVERLIAMSLDQQGTHFKKYEQYLINGYERNGRKISFEDVQEELAANISND